MNIPAKWLISQNSDRTNNLIKSYLMVQVFSSHQIYFNFEQFLLLLGYIAYKN